VVEVVSLDKESRERDYEKKRTDYAAAGIAEYWIVDPAESRITVLTLDGESYTVHGEFHAGDAATSVLLESFSVDVTSVFAAAKA
jgi:Uma2 family endonuclease